MHFCFQMHISYWFGTAVGDLLFNGFTITSPSGREQYIYQCQCSLYESSLHTQKAICKCVHYRRSYQKNGDVTANKAWPSSLGFDVG
jgi:hypothetical protein